MKKFRIIKHQQQRQQQQYQMEKKNLCGKEIESTNCNKYCGLITGITKRKTEITQQQRQ